jgi:glutathione S-transferase
VNWAEWAGVEVEEFPNAKKRLGIINERPAVQRGLKVPGPFKMKEKMKAKEGEEEYAKHHSDWVMTGQSEDQEKHKWVFGWYKSGLRLVQI